MITLLALSACGTSNETATTPPSTGGGAQATAPTTAAPSTPANKASSEELKKWQADLDKVGCSAGPVDGIETGETEAAIRAFQAHSRLQVDGKIGPRTQATLRSAATSGKRVCAAPPSANAPGTNAPGTAAPGTTPATPGTDQTSSGCPPSCSANLGIYPGSGPAGTTVIISSAGNDCAGEVRYLGPDDKELESAGNMVAAGAGQYTLTFTIPPGSPGQYRFRATTCGALTYFSLT